MEEETGAGYPVASEIRLGGLLRLFLRHNHLIGAKVKGCAQKITQRGLQFPRTSIGLCQSVAISGSPATCPQVFPIWRRASWFHSDVLSAIA
jgi:hypothetical protein